MGAESPHSHGSGHRAAEGSWRPSVGRGKGIWVRRERRQRRHFDATGARRAQAGAPLPLPRPSPSCSPQSLGSSPVRAHTYTRAHTHMRASQCLAPYGGSRFKRDQFSLYIIYIFLKKPSLVLWWRRWGSWRHPKGWHALLPPMPIMVTKLEGSMGGGGGGAGIHHAGGTRRRRRRRGRARAAEAAGPLGAGAP